MILKYQNRLKALMIDDDAEFLGQIRRILRTLDVELSPTGSKEDFLSQLEILKPQFCLVDLNINGIDDGFAMIQAARRHLGSETTIFVVSANGDWHAVTRALELGATDYFLKPMDRDVLERKLAYYFKDAISSNQNNFYSVPTQGPQSVEIEFPTQVLSVDEFGLQFRAPHLLPKGTSLKITGAFVEDLTGQKKVLTSVLENQLDPASKQYVYYAEFEDVTDECLIHVRKWLSQRTVS